MTQFPRCMQPPEPVVLRVGLVVVSMNNNGAGCDDDWMTREKEISCIRTYGIRPEAIWQNEDESMQRQPETERQQAMQSEKQKEYVVQL